MEIPTLWHPDYGAIFNIIILNILISILNETHFYQNAQYVRVFRKCLWFGWLNLLEKYGFITVMYAYATAAVLRVQRDAYWIASILPSIKLTDKPSDFRISKQHCWYFADNGVQPGLMSLTWTLLNLRWSSVFSGVAKSSRTNNFLLLALLD